MSAVELKSSIISERKIELAVPEGTTVAQWQQLRRAMNYGAAKGVSINITVVK